MSTILALATPEVIRHVSGILAGSRTDRRASILILLAMEALAERLSHLDSQAGARPVRPDRGHRGLLGPGAGVGRAVGRRRRAAGAAGAAGTLLGGWLADRYGRLPAIRAGYALALPGLAGLLAAPGPKVATLAGAVLGLALFIPFSVQVTLAQEYLPARVGTAGGLTLGLAVTAGGVLAPLLGVLGDHAGLLAALAVLLILPIVALLASTRLPEPYRQYRAGAAGQHTVARPHPPAKHPPRPAARGLRSARRRRVSG